MTTQGRGLAAGKISPFASSFPRLTASWTDLETNRHVAGTGTAFSRLVGRVNLVSLWWLKNAKR